MTALKPSAFRPGGNYPLCLKVGGFSGVFTPVSLTDFGV